jgi:hypothetical protein
MGVRAAKIFVGLLVGPHELGHAIPAAIAGLSPKITILPAWDGATPLGQFDASVTASTSPTVIRICALAPLPLYLGVATVLGTILPAESPLAVVLFPAVTFWATLSSGDIAVATNPAAVREAGRFQAPIQRWQTPMSLVLIPVVTVVVAALFFTDIR